MPMAEAGTGHVRCFCRNGPMIDRMVLTDFVLGPGVIGSLMPRANLESRVSEKFCSYGFFIFLALISPGIKNSLSLNYFYEQHPVKTKGNCDVETARARKV